MSGTKIFCALPLMGMDLEKLEETADAHDAPVKDEASERSPDAPKTADAYILERDFGPKVPWSRLAGWVKCMRPSDFDDEQRRAFELTFAGFFEEQHTDESVIEAARHSLGGLDVKVEPAFAFRRYAGGSNLPRSRYYSVCQNSSGDDGGTLRNELCSYVDLRVSGEISVMDFTEPMLLGAKLANQDRFTRDEFPEYPLGVSFQSARGINSPWGEQLQNTRRAESGARIHMVHGFTIFLPLRVEPMIIERVIDLRLPAVQEWLAQSVFSGIPTARFIYSDSIPRATDLGETMRLLLALSTPQLLLDPSEISKYAANSSKGNSGTPPIKGNWTDVKFYATHPDGTKNGIAGLTDNAFHNLLPLLLFHPKGGSPITEAIGEWLRSLGANALIYPSARSDIRVEIEDGAVTRFAGWNLLDYRDAPPPPRLLRLIQHPASNARTRTQLSRGLPREERLKGSFSISGIQACEWQDWVFQEELYYQAKMFADTPALYLKEWSSPTLNRTLSLADIRGLLKIGVLDYSIEFTRGAAPQSRPIGQWLADYLDARIPNYTTNRVGYGEEWFFYRLEPTFEPQIICPICEYNRIWSLDRKEPVDRACPVCGYPGPHEINPEVTAVRFFELCDRL